jgi:predicted PurR-regulated permease PerM
MASQTQSQGVGHVVARVGGGLVLIGATLLVLRPFLVPMIWAAILAYVTWPLFQRVRVWSGRPGLTAGVFTLLQALGVALPLVWLLVALASEATSLVGSAKEWLDAGAPAPQWIDRYPWLATRVAELRAQPIPGPTDLAEVLTKYGAQVSGRLVDLAGGVARNLFAVTITLITLYAFYVHGERLIVHARRLARVVFPGTSESFVDDVGGVVRAVVFGLLGTAIVQGTLAAIGFAIFGVPSAVILGTATSVLSFVPAGPPIVWGGAALWLFFQGSPVWTWLGMAAWGVLLVSSVDNVLRPILISSGPTPIPFLLVFFGVLGGLAAFGVLGLFLGPVLLSIAFTLIAEFPRRTGADTSA